MTAVFQDTAKKRDHDDFIQWKSDNPDGYIINDLGNGTGMLHRSDCRHINGPHQTVEEGKSMTVRRKLCSLDRDDLNSNATDQKGNKLSIECCESCKP